MQLELRIHTNEHEMGLKVPVSLCFEIFRSLIPDEDLTQMANPKPENY